MFSYGFSLHLNDLDTTFEVCVKQIMLFLITQFFETNLKIFKCKNDNDIFQYFPNSKKKTHTHSHMTDIGIYDKLCIQNIEPSGSEL
jgi:hypothetical protein